jgi:glutathione S-transferase
MIRIYNFPRGVRGLRVGWLCLEMGLDYEAVAVDFPTDAAYRAKNPLGSVPFLEDEDGVAINESVAMLLYVTQRYGPTPLMPGPDDPDLARVLQMTVFSEASLGGVMNPLMEAKFGAPEADKRNWSVSACEARVEAGLAYVEHGLGQGPFLAGDRFTVADIAIATTLGLWRGALDKTLSEPFAAYHARATARPAWQAARAKAGL